MSARLWTRGPLWQGWRAIRLIIGFAVLIVGLLMIVLPGPAVVVIPVGLAILATEFAWARRLLQQLRDRAEVIHEALKKKRGKEMHESERRPDQNVNKQT